MTSNERFNELMKRIIKEYDKTGGNLALSGIEFARYFDVEEEIIPVLFNKMNTTGRFILRKEEDLDTGEEVERIQIHPDIKRNYWLKSTLVEKEAEILLDLGARLKQPFNSDVKNIQIEYGYVVRLDLRDQQLCYLPNSIGNLIHLKDLILKNNPLISLPRSLLNLTRLKTLDLDDTQILESSSLEEFSKLPYLKYLWFQQKNFAKTFSKGPEVPEREVIGWQCNVCLYVYKEEFPFDDLPDTWGCPKCLSSKTEFVKDGVCMPSLGGEEYFPRGPGLQSLLKRNEEKDSPSYFNPEVNKFITLARDQKEKGQFKEAIESFQQARSLIPISYFSGKDASWLKECQNEVLSHFKKLLRTHIGTPRLKIELEIEDDGLRAHYRDRSSWIQRKTPFSTVCRHLRIDSEEDRRDLLIQLLWSGTLKALLLSSSEKRDFQLNLFYDPNWYKKVYLHEYLSSGEYEALLAMIQSLKRYIYTPTVTTNPDNILYLDLACQLQIPVLPEKDRIYPLGYVTLEDGHLVSLSMASYGRPKQYTTPILIAAHDPMAWWYRVSPLEDISESLGQLIYLEHLDLSDNGLKTLPSSLSNCTRLISLKVSNNQLDPFPAFICNLTQLEKLNLSSNWIPEIPDAIQNLTKLEQLLLRSNRVVQLSQAVQHFLKNFDTQNGWVSWDDELISFDHNTQEKQALADMGIKCDFKYCTTIEDEHIVEVDLSRWEGRIRIPPSIVQLPYLRKLDARGKSLEEIPTEIEKLRHLEILNLDFNNLKTLPESIGNLTSLTELSVQENPLKSVPSTLGLLCNLRILKLHCKRMGRGMMGEYYVKKEHFLDICTQHPDIDPDIIGIMIALTENQLTQLPESIGNLTELEELWLGGNWLSTLPDTIGNLMQLKVLDLSKNFLTSLPESITNLTNLTTLNVGGPLNRVFENLGKESSEGPLNQWLLDLEKGGCTVEYDWYWYPNMIYVKDVMTGEWLKEEGRKWRRKHSQ